MIELKGERGKQKPGDFSTPLLAIYITENQGYKKPNNTINQIDLTDVDWTFHLTITENMFLQVYMEHSAR